jgi:hypothetical protein
MDSFNRGAPATGWRAATLALGVLVAALPAACAPATPSPSPVTDASKPAASAELQALVRAVSDDAQRISGADASRIRVLDAAAVTWSDGSLGCPAPNRFYTQALVPGYRVRIEAGGKVFVYHANARGDWALCPAERARPPVGDGRA